MCVFGILACLLVGTQSTNIIGNWSSIQTFRKLSGSEILYENPALNKNIKTKGTMTLISSFSLTKNHRFSWRPFHCEGKWTFAKNQLSMSIDAKSLDHVDPFFARFNDYSHSKTNGIPDINLTYSEADKSFALTLGMARYHLKTIYIFHKRK